MSGTLAARLARLGSATDRRIAAVAGAFGVPQHRIFALIGARRAASHPIKLHARRREGNLLRAGAWAALIPPDRGFAPIPHDFPNLAKVVESGQRILRTWESSAPLTRDASRSRAPYLNVLTQADLAAHPAILDFALSQSVVEVLAGYFGQVPRLRQLGIHVTPPNASGGDSQTFHRDARDQNSRKIRCFINLDTVTRDSGPFTFVPMDASERICRDLGRRWWDKGHFADEEVLPRCRPGELNELLGPAGTGVFVDTSLCLHFGNRTAGERRAVLMLHYTEVPDTRVPRGAPPPEPLLGHYDLSGAIVGTNRASDLLLSQHG